MLYIFHSSFRALTSAAVEMVSLVMELVAETLMNVSLIMVAVIRMLSASILRAHSRYSIKSILVSSSNKFLCMFSSLRVVMECISGGDGNLSDKYDLF
jgi:predicted small integral membrane protein